MSKEVFEIGLKLYFSFPKTVKFEEIFAEAKEGFFMEVYHSNGGLLDSKNISSFYVDEDGDLIIQWLHSEFDRRGLYNWSNLEHVVSERMEE